MTEELSFPRRAFLRLSAKISLGLAGVMGLGGLVRYFSHNPTAKALSSYDLGMAADFPSNGKLLRLDIPAVIYKTKAGFQAYSLICTHLGCTVEEHGEEYSCPCHGSRFDHQGKVLKGPAPEQLTTLKITLSDDGRLILDTRGVGK